MLDEEKEKGQEEQPASDAAAESEAQTEAGSAESADMPNGLDLGAIYDVPVQVSAVLGKASLHVNQLLKLGRGAIIELDRKVGEAIDIYVNNRLVARGEIVVMDDDQIGVTMTEIIKSDVA